MNSGTIGSTQIFHVPDYDLAATLNSGQAFRWHAQGNGWIGIIGGRWVRLQSDLNCGTVTAQTALPVTDWSWLRKYLQLELSLETVLASFPEDEPMRAAVTACRGLRLLRQEPWECLASFILSSTKQIVQIRQMIALLCGRFGEPIRVPQGHAPAWSFPSAARLAAAGESELRACKLGFRAPYLLASARRVVENPTDLPVAGSVPLEETRARLLELPGVGRKIADCVLLFAYGFQTAFPMDVWVLRALRQLYFAGKRPSIKRLQKFAGSHFGPNAGYAQQYLFHYMRTKQPRSFRLVRPGKRGIRKTNERSAASPPQFR